MLSQQPFLENNVKIWFLFNFAQSINVNLISLLHDSKEGYTMQEINMTHSSSRCKNFCKNIYYVPFSKHQEVIALSVEVTSSNVLVFIFEDYELSLKMIQYVSKLSSKNKTIIVFNTNRLTEEKLENTLINSNISKLKI